MSTGARPENLHAVEDEVMAGRTLLHRDHGPAGERQRHRPHHEADGRPRPGEGQDKRGLESQLLGTDQDSLWLWRQFILMTGPGGRSS